MSDIQLRQTIQINKGNLRYFPRSEAILADFETDEPQGETPGGILIPEDGMDIDFAEITNFGGIIHFKNREAAGGPYFTYGKYDPSVSKFHPVHDVLPGEEYVARLSRWLLAEFAGTGTGSSGSNSTFYVKAFGGPCRAYIGAFDR